MKNSKRFIAVAKINTQHLVPAYIVTAFFFAIGIYNLAASLTGLTDNYYVDMANYLYVFAVMAPIVTVSRNFKRFMHLNGSKRDFYVGCFLNYCIFALSISFLDIVMFVITKAAFSTDLVIQNLVEVFGWWGHGVIVAFIQQFIFVLLIEVFVHTLTSMQTRWYGVLADGVIAAILIIFISIPELRSLLVSFFNIIIFHSNAMIQIMSCGILSAVIFLIYLPILQRKKL